MRCKAGWFSLTPLELSCFSLPCALVLIPSLTRFVCLERRLSGKSNCCSSRRPGPSSTVGISQPPVTSAAWIWYPLWVPAHTWHANTLAYIHIKIIKPKTTTKTASCFDVQMSRHPAESSCAVTLFSAVQIQCCCGWQRREQRADQETGSGYPGTKRNSQTENPLRGYWGGYYYHDTFLFPFSIPPSPPLPFFLCPFHPSR